MHSESYPLSPIQQGMLVHWLRDRHSGTDIEQIVAELNEHVDRDRLEAGWNDTLAAFETLRTAFAWDGLREPVQRVVPQASIRVAEIDLRSVDADARTYRVDAFLEADRHEGFDLASAPAMRVTLFRLADAQFVMVWSFHHILVDGRSFELVLNRVFAAYDGGDAPGVSARPYREYVEWVSAQDPSTAREFWRRTLAGFTAPTALPHDAAGAAGAGFHEMETCLPVETTRGLRDVAAREQISLNTLVMGAWALLLSRYSGESDVVFGATKTTRRGTVPGAERMIGLFLATVPVRIAVESELPVREWLKQLRERWVAIRGHEHLPLVDIRQASALPAGVGLFDSLVVFENYKFATRLRDQGGRWAARSFRLLENTGFPLSFLVYADDALALKLEYDARRFHAATARRFLEELQRILTAWSVDVTISLWQTPVLAPEEERWLLEEWNTTRRAYPRERSLAALLEEQVDRTPDEVALVVGSEQLTYRELDDRANALTRRLIQFGAGPDRLVGVCLERSAAMMVALLAVVKSGAAYLPIDPLLPPARIRYMLTDSEPVGLITQESLRPATESFPGQVISIDGAAESAGGPASSRERPHVTVQSEALAYVIYTSGSTGKPKGVQVPRGALLNLLWSMREWLGLGPADRLLAVTTISFDIAGVDVWLPWLVGARTIMASREQAADGAQLRTLIARHGVTFLQATPVTWRLLLGAGWTGDPAMQVVCTGEAMPPEVARALTPIVRRTWNLYGPTETTIWSTGFQLVAGDAPVLIGRPVANTECYILDAHRQPVPVGAPGELYIAGDGLARGYLNRPDLTEEKFVPHLLRRGARMYRTGDLARYRADGNIECLGRTDDQVKIRGFRIELGEIESVLKALPQIKEAIVLAREDAAADKRLVAYYVPAEGPIDAAELRAQMKDNLPEYMVPSAYVPLDAMPLTSNGKVDKKSLPMPDAGAIATGRHLMPPRTHIEKQLTEIWEELFSLPNVSVDDDFFDLGGHSLLALSMMNRVAEVFGKQLPLNVLFESPTVAQLARHLERHQKTVGQHTLVSIQASGSRPPIFWIPGGAALGLFRLRHIVTRLGPEQPVYGLGSSHPKSLDGVEGVEQRAGHYLELVRAVQPHGPYCLAGFCAGGRVAYEMAQRLSAAGERVAFLGMINCWYPGYPSGRIRRLTMRVQHMLHRVRAARAGGNSLRQVLLDWRAARREARQRHAELDATRVEVAAHGFHERDRSQSEVLLEATTAKFEEYTPAPYPGRVSLFISDDAAVAGVSRGLDPRFAWARQAADHEIRIFPGGHDAVLEMPHAVAFAETLKAALEEALETNSANTGHLETVDDEAR